MIMVMVILVVIVVIVVVIVWPAALYFSNLPDCRRMVGVLLVEIVANLGQCLNVLFGLNEDVIFGLIVCIDEPTPELIVSLVQQVHPFAFPRIGRQSLALVD